MQATIQYEIHITNHNNILQMIITEESSNLTMYQQENHSTHSSNAEEPPLDEYQLSEAASSLRTELDILLDKFRIDTTIEIEPELALEVRQALQDEFVVLLSKYTPETLQKAVLLSHDESKRLPIHLACDKNAPISILTALLNADVAKESIRIPDYWGDLPLHTACARHQTEVVKLLLDSDGTKRTLYTKADNGSLPIHTAVRYGAPASVVKLLIEGGNESTLFERGFFDMLPLHAACRIGTTPDVVDLLLRWDPSKQSVMEEDNAERIPIHLAILHTVQQQVEVVEVLLKGMLCGRMERKGLDNWKSDMRSLLKSMATHERDFTCRDKLDMICDTIRQFMERVFTLELAVWRASCLQFDTRFQNIDEVLELERSSVDGEFDEHEYKVHQRIMSGADVVVHHVIPFLEDEPVEDLVRQLRDYS